MASETEPLDVRVTRRTSFRLRQQGLDVHRVQRACSHARPMRSMSCCGSICERTDAHCGVAAGASASHAISFDTGSRSTMSPIPRSAWTTSWNSFLPGSRPKRIRTVTFRLPAARGNRCAHPSEDAGRARTRSHRALKHSHAPRGWTGTHGPASAGAQVDPLLRQIALTPTQAPIRSMKGIRELPP
jgi:hypothetical protein